MQRNDAATPTPEDYGVTEELVQTWLEDADDPRLTPETAERVRRFRLASLAAREAVELDRELRVRKRWRVVSVLVFAAAIGVLLLFFLVAAPNTTYLGFVFFVLLIGGVMAVMNATARPSPYGVLLHAAYSRGEELHVEDDTIGHWVASFERDNAMGERVTTLSAGGSDRWKAEVALYVKWSAEFDETHS